MLIEKIASSTGVECVEEDSLAVSVATLKDVYMVGETINLTDPPDYEFNMQSVKNGQIPDDVSSSINSYEDEIPDDLVEGA